MSRPLLSVVTTGENDRSFTLKPRLERFSADHIARCREAFKLYDKDGYDGRLTPNEIWEAVKRFSKSRWCRPFRTLQDVTLEDVETLLRRLDDDSNGFFDFDEFVRLMYRLQQGEILPSISTESIDLLPEGGVGGVGGGSPLLSPVPRSIFDTSMFYGRPTTPTSGKVSAGSSSRLFAQSGPRTPTPEDEEEELYLELFIQFDFLKQGIITPFELRKTWECFGLYASMEETVAVVKKLDQDEKGGLNFEEFRMLMDGIGGLDEDD